MFKSTRILLVGLGPIGCAVGRGIIEADDLELAAAADPMFAGQQLGTVLGEPAIEGRVWASIDDAMNQPGAEASVAVLCTGSSVASVTQQIQASLGRGLHVVSTCEELSCPRHRSPEAARMLDTEARRQGRVVVGTGVNPGLVMDRLVLTAAAACVRVDRVEVSRVVDASKRRGPLQKKVGAGLSAAEFQTGVQGGRLGHVGLGESARLVAEGLGFWSSRVQLDESIEPVLGDDGAVLGLRQRALIREGERELVSLKLQMSVGATEPHDHILIHGDPPVDLWVRGGFHGDRATVGCVLHAVRQVGGCTPGLHTVTSLPVGARA